MDWVENGPPVCGSNQLTKLKYYATPSLHQDDHAFIFLMQTRRRLWPHVVPGMPWSPRWHHWYTAKLRSQMPSKRCGPPTCDLLPRSRSSQSRKAENRATPSVVRIRTGCRTTPPRYAVEGTVAGLKQR